MQERRNTKQIWFYIFIAIIFIYFIGFLLKLSFISPKFHYFFTMCLFIVSVISLNKSVFKNQKLLKCILNIFSITFITLSIFYHLFFEHFLYVTIIDLNGSKIAVQEHSMYDEYDINFYKVKYVVFKQPLANGPFICLDYPAFHIGNYKVINSNSSEAVIEYRNPKYELMQRVTINY